MACQARCTRCYPCFTPLERKNGTICRQPGAPVRGPRLSALSFCLGLRLVQLPLGALALELHHAAVESAAGHQLVGGPRPLSSTTMRSAPATVRIRWAMTSTVLPASRRERAPWTLVSFSTSRLAVASSSRTMGASFKRARAMEMRWRSPPESLAPFSPMGVS